MAKQKKAPSSALRFKKNAEWFKMYPPQRKIGAHLHDYLRIQMKNGKSREKCVGKIPDEIFTFSWITGNGFKNC